MVFGPTDSVLATSGGIEDPDIIELWNPWTGKLLKTLENTRGHLIFSADGKELITDSEKYGLKIFKMPEGEVAYSGASIGDPVGLTKTGEIVAYDNNGKTANFFSLKDKKMDRSLHFNAWYKFAYDPYYNVIASIAARGKIVLRDADDSHLLYTFGETCTTCGRINRVNDIFVNSVDGSLAIQTQDRVFRVWSLPSNKFQPLKRLPRNWKTVGSNPSPEQRKLMEELNESRMSEAFCFSSDSKHIALVLGDRVEVFDVDSEGIVQAFPNKSFGPECSFSADGKILIIENEVGATLTDLVSEKELGTLVSLADSDWVFVTPEGLYDGTADGIKYPHWVENNRPILLEEPTKSKRVPGLLKKSLLGDVSVVR
jgi:WD40 repeat protein